MFCTARQSSPDTAFLFGGFGKFEAAVAVFNEVVFRVSRFGF